MNTKDATLDNEVGWYGTLDGFPEIVLTACDHAVELAKKSNPNVATPAEWHSQ